MASRGDRRSTLACAGPDGARGLTLVEVVVALALGGLVVLLAHRLCTGVLEGVRRVDQARTALDRAMNARRYLSEAFGSLAIGQTGDGPFTGHPAAVAFDTWQWTPQGFHTRHHVDLHVDEGRLVAEGVKLGDSVAALGCDYLLEPGEEAKWVREWISPLSAPLAVRLRVIRESGVIDTMLFLIGPRG